MTRLTEQIARMQELMGVKPSINENTVSIKGIETYSNGADGKIYAVIKENNKYFIKTASDNSPIIRESFDYIGGITNKKQYEYTSCSNAIKQMELKLQSLNESYGVEDEDVSTDNVDVTTDIEGDDYEVDSVKIVGDFEIIPTSENETEVTPELDMGELGDVNENDDVEGNQEILNDEDTEVVDVEKKEVCSGLSDITYDDFKSLSSILDDESNEQSELLHKILKEVLPELYDEYTKEKENIQNENRIIEAITNKILKQLTEAEDKPSLKPNKWLSQNGFNVLLPYYNGLIRLKNEMKEINDVDKINKLEDTSVKIFLVVNNILNSMREGEMNKLRRINSIRLNDDEISQLESSINNVGEEGMTQLRDIFDDLNKSIGIIFDNKIEGVEDDVDKSNKEWAKKRNELGYEKEVDELEKLDKQDKEFQNESTEFGKHPGYQKEFSVMKGKTDSKGKAFGTDKGDDEPYDETVTEVAKVVMNEIYESLKKKES